MDDKTKAMIKRVKELVEMNILIPDYEVTKDSYLCVVHRLPTYTVLYQGKLDTFLPDEQKAFLGLYLNDSIGDYKITGIYRTAEL